MAAKTPDSIIRESLGSLTLLICPFETANIDNEDTYTSGLNHVVINGLMHQRIQHRVAKE